MWFMLLMSLSKDRKLNTVFTAVPDSCPEECLHGWLILQPNLSSQHWKVGKAFQPMTSVKAGRRYQRKQTYLQSH